MNPEPDLTYSIDCYGMITYARFELLSLRPTITVAPSEQHRPRYGGCRAGRNKCNRFPSLTLDNQVHPVLIGNRAGRRRTCSKAAYYVKLTTHMETP